MKYRDLREKIPAFSIKENDSRPDIKKDTIKGRKERKENFFPLQINRYNNKKKNDSSPPSIMPYLF